MNRILISIFVCLTLMCCKREKPVEGVLSEAEMVSVLMQMYVAEERLTRVGIPYDSITKLVPYFRTKVFQVTGIPDSTYRKSMEYYMANPKKLEFIYTALIDSLSLKEQSQPNNSAPNDLPQ